jgi:hypothetical protein
MRGGRESRTPDLTMYGAIELVEVTGGIWEDAESLEDDFKAAAAAAYCLCCRERGEIQSEQIRGCFDDPIQTQHQHHSYFVAPSLEAYL